MPILWDGEILMPLERRVSVREGSNKRYFEVVFHGQCQTN